MSSGIFESSTTTSKTYKVYVVYLSYLFLLVSLPLQVMALHCYWDWFFRPLIGIDVNFWQVAGAILTVRMTTGYTSPFNGSNPIRTNFALPFFWLVLTGFGYFLFLFT